MERRRVGALAVGRGAEKGGSSPGRQQEDTGKRGREGRACLWRNACRQSGRWDGEITLPGVGEVRGRPEQTAVTFSPRAGFSPVIDAALGSGAE